MKKTKKLLSLLFFLLSINVRADDGGGSFWLSGSCASFAAVPMSPGWSFPLEFIYTDLKNNKLTAEKSALDDSSELEILYVTPTYTAKTTFLNAVFSTAIALGAGYNFASGGYPLKSDSTLGVSDIAPTLSLAWNSGVNNWMTYISGNIPVGNYNVNSFSGTGLGFWAVDIGGAYTYYNENKGLEFSLLIGGTYNFQNPHTDYKSGIDSHLDWEASKFFDKNWQLGIAGYLYYQLTDDEGDDAIFGHYRSSAVGIGPELGYSFKIWNKELSTNLRGYYAFFAKNRLGGLSIFLNLNLSF